MSGKNIKKIDVVENDVFGDLRKSAQETTPSITLLKESLIMIHEAQIEIEKQAKKIKGQLLKVDPSEAKNQKDLTAAVKEATKVAQDYDKTQRAKVAISKQLTIEQAKEKEALRQANLQSKQIARLKLAEVNSIEAVRAKLALVTTAWTRLTKEEIENTKRGARLNESKKQLTETLKRLEQATGDHRRDVGNYGKALDGLKSKFSQISTYAQNFGLVLGGVAILRGAVTTIQEFGQSIADLQAITGASGADLDKYKQSAIEMGKTTQGGAKAVVEAFKLIGSAKPELLENAEALIAVTEAARTLSKASGMELPDAATALTDAMNQFGASSDQAGRFINVLAAGSKFGSAEIPQVTEALLKFGAVAKTSNVNIEESTALIEALAERGLKGAEAGTALRNVMLKLSAPDALPKEAQERMKALGISFEDLKDTSKPFSERLEALKPLLKDNAALIKVFGDENAVSATNLIDSVERIKELNEQVTGTNTAFEQAETRSKTLGEAFNTLKETWNAYVLNMSEGIGAADGLTGALDFLSENLETILDLAKRGALMWITYKSAMLAMKLKESYSDWKNLSKGISETNNSLKDGASNGQRFGQALKGVGFAVAINLAIELGMELYNIASGAEDAARAVEGMNKAIADGNKYASERLQKLRDEVGLGLKTEEQMKQQVKAEIKLMNAEKASTKEKIKALEADQRYQAAIGKNALFRSSYEERLIRRMESYKNALYETNSELTAFNRELTDVTISEKKNEQAVRENVKTTKQRTTETEDLSKKLEVLKWVLRDTTEAEQKLAEVRRLSMDPDEVEAALALEKERALTLSDIALLEAEIALKKAEQAGNADEIRKAEERVKQAKIEAINAQLKYDLANETDPAKRRELELKAELDILNLNSKEKEEIAKKNYENEKKYIDLTDQYLQKSLENRIEAIDREIEASKKRADDLREQANQGNVDAKESIAIQEQIQADAQLKREKLERRKQQVAAITAFFQTYLSEREKGTPSAEAFAIAGLDKAALESVVNLLPTFLEGTDRTQNVGSGIDGKGGFHAILHPDEMVFTKEEREAMGGISREEVIAKVQQSEVKNMGNTTVSGWENLGMIAELSGVRKDLSAVKKAIENIPETNIELGAITQSAMEIVERRRVGNRKTQSTFKVRG